jgi:hypothetical protein
MKTILVATIGTAFLVGALFGTMLWSNAPRYDMRFQSPPSTAGPLFGKREQFDRATNVSSAPTAVDLRRAKMLREAAVEFDRELTFQDAKVRRLRSQATELEQRVFASAWTEAEELFAAGHRIAAESFAKADAVEARNEAITDAWLAELQNRTTMLELKMRRLSGRLP